MKKPVIDFNSLTPMHVQKMYELLEQAQMLMHTTKPEVTIAGRTYRRDELSTRISEWLTKLSGVKGIPPEYFYRSDEKK